MGQKASPIANRLGYIKGWEANWFAEKKDFAARLHEDNQIRKYFDKHFPKIIARVVIERSSGDAVVTVFSSKPGVLIGPGGQKVQEVKKALQKITKRAVQLNMLEVKVPALSALLTAKDLASQIEGRNPYKRACMRVVEDAMRIGAKGIKIRLSGRLRGAEIARHIIVKEGRVPSQTLRADIDFAKTEAHTSYGVIGVQVTIFLGEVYGKRDLSLNVEAPKPRKGRNLPYAQK